jgi:hypothetical protein
LRQDQFTVDKCFGTPQRHKSNSRHVRHEFTWTRHRPPRLNYRQCPGGPETGNQ